MLYTGAPLLHPAQGGRRDRLRARAGLLAQTTLTLDHPAELAVAGVLIRFQAANPNPNPNPNPHPHPNPNPNPNLNSNPDPNPNQEALERATSTLLPNHLCEYVYELCGKVSSFVRECKVLGSPEQNSRVLLVTASILPQATLALGIGFSTKSELALSYIVAGEMWKPGGRGGFVWPFAWYRT